MAQQREYVTVNGKEYPLKTEAERSASQSAPQTETHPVTGGNVSIPAPRTGNRTVTLALLVAFGIYALAGEKGVAKLSRVQGYLQTVPQAEQATQAKALEGSGSGGGNIGGNVFTPRAIFAWMLLFLILQILADFDATSELAGSMAVLIMFTSMIALGPTALANVTTLVA